MTHFIKGLDRQQKILLPKHLDDYVDENSHIRAIDAFVDMLELAVLGFNAQADATGRPGYHPGLMLRIYLYGYLNQVQSSRRLEGEFGRNLELIWLTGRLKPDFKTIADFRKDNGPAIRKVCQKPAWNARYESWNICKRGPCATEQLSSAWMRPEKRRSHLATQTPIHGDNSTHAAHCRL